MGQDRNGTADGTGGWQPGTGMDPPDSPGVRMSRETHDVPWLGSRAEGGPGNDPGPDGPGPLPSAPPGAGLRPVGVPPWSPVPGLGPWPNDGEIPVDASIRGIKPGRGWPGVCIALVLLVACISPWVEVGPSAELPASVALFRLNRLIIGTLSAVQLLLSGLVVLGYGNTPIAVGALVASAASLPFAIGAAGYAALEGWARSMSALTMSDPGARVEVSTLPGQVLVLAVAAVVMSGVMLGSERLHGPAPKLFRRRLRARER